VGLIFHFVYSGLGESNPLQKIGFIYIAQEKECKFAMYPAIILKEESVMSKDNAAKKVLISLPEKFLAEIDIVADEEQRTRSELIREALRAYIRNPQRSS
jgi:CopG family transcriptional regulator/antitoxin EndoAI